MVEHKGKPNFFIVGAPKCGTTALNNYLAEHPDIFMADKESHFFGSDLSFLPRVRADRTLAWYLNLFSGWSGQKRIGESSVWYLYSQSAPQEILAFAPDAKIIVMLRNPIDAMYSNFAQFKYSGYEDIDSLEEALLAEPDRKSGARISPHALYPDGLLYRENMRYTEHVKRYFDVFGRDRVHVIIYDDFKQDTQEAYRNALAFLGVDTVFSPEFRVINANKRARNMHLQHILFDSPAWYIGLKKAARAMIPAFVRSGLEQRIRQWNTSYVKRDPMEPALYRQLQVEIAPDIIALSELLERDLSHWCQLEDGA